LELYYLPVSIPVLIFGLNNFPTFDEYYYLFEYNLNFS